MSQSYSFTSESVSEGHPDKVCDQVSDAILDACLMQDPESHVACETLATTNYMLLAGEITTNAKIDYVKIAREVISAIGYTYPGIGFSADEVIIDNRIHAQSADIANKVARAADDSQDQGAGDQGLMFGYACDETEALMPAPIFYAHRIIEKLAEIRHAGLVDFLRPDAKSQVTIEYDDNGEPVRLTDLVVSSMHAPGTKTDVQKLVREMIPTIISENLLEGFDLNGAHCHINSGDDFVIGGPNGDCGLTGRKIIVDTYGGMGRHGGGAFSGKDPSKVDRSACYMARYAAKNIVKAGLARRCEVQVAYGIGLAHPLNYMVNTFGTGKVADSTLTEMLRDGKIFDFRPSAIIKHLGLKHPGNDWNYRQTASCGHFGRDCFPWEKTDKVDEILASCKG